MTIEAIVAEGTWWLFGFFGREPTSDRSMGWGHRLANASWRGNAIGTGSTTTSWLNTGPLGTTSLLSCSWASCSRQVPPGSFSHRAAMSRAAALLAWAPGLGFGLPCIYGIWYFADRGVVWTFLSFPTYGGGPFEDVGIETTVTLLVSFLLVCVAEVVAGFLLWRKKRSGGLLALVLLPLEFAFWIGFALPLGPVVGLARTGLVLMAWPEFRAADARRTAETGAR